MFQNHSLFMCMEGGVSKTLPVIFAKKLAIHQTNVVNFIPRATAICPLPLFWRHLSLPETPSRQVKHKHKNDTPNLVSTNVLLLLLWDYLSFLNKKISASSGECIVSLPLGNYPRKLNGIDRLPSQICPEQLFVTLVIVRDHRIAKVT